MLQATTSGNISRTRRRNTTKACEECRRRRSKCDGERPNCSRCIRFGLTCRYTTQEDGRQPASKSYVMLLRRRIQNLESVLELHGIDVQSAVNHSTTVASHLSPVLPSPAKTALPQNRTLEPLHHDNDGDNDNDDYDVNTINRDLSAALKGAFITDESLSFDTHGEPRFFGSVSGRPELSRINKMSNSPNIPDFGNLPSFGNRSISVPEVPGLDTEYLVSSELKYHLIDLFFTWHHTWFCVLNERLFRDCEQNGGRYCTPLLLNSIFAMGARFSDRKELRSHSDEPQSAGKIFLERAEALLPADLKWPSITTVQSLCILSTVAIAHGSDASGWLYEGMAKSLTLDMGLNIDPGGLAISGGLTREEIELRRLLYWSLYCNDKLSALYTGRVCTMLSSQARVELPNLQSHFSVEDQSHATAPVSHGYALFLKAMVALSRILETILTTLCTPQSTERKVKSSFFGSCLLDLKNWSYDLPAEVRVDKVLHDSKSPHVFILHMVFHTTYIIVARFFSTVQNDQVSRGEDPSANGVVEELRDHATQICYRAAREICGVAVQYRRTFGSFRQSPITATHCTLSAALVLLQKWGMEASKGSSASTGDQNDLNLCLTVLSELSCSWYPARRFRFHIGNLLPDCRAHPQVAEERLAGKSVLRETTHADTSDQHHGDLQYSATEKMQNDTDATRKDASNADPLLQGTEYEQTVPEFDFNLLNSYSDSHFDPSLQDSTLPMDYLNFDIANNWFSFDSFESTL